MLIHVIDFEGTLKCGIIEYGIVTLDGDRIENTYTGLCRADEPIRPQEMLLHGIRNEMLEGNLPFSNYQKFFYDLRHSGVLAAHHAPFENSLLNRYWNVVPSIGASSQSVASTGSWGPWIDSRLVAQQYFKSDDYSLGALIKAFDLQSILDTFAEIYCPTNRQKSHCALYDALASALLLISMQASYHLDVAALVRSSQTRAQSSRRDFAQDELF